MRFTRREFVVLSSALACGCAAGERGGGGPVELKDVDAGPIEQYASDGVYDAHQQEGFFIVRRGERLMALSSVCTHRTCDLRARQDHTFACQCHGSTFGPNGQVMRGPASRDLPEFATSVSAQARLIVHVGRPSAAPAGRSS